jgi:ornithine cyclodeaminase
MAILLTDSDVRKLLPIAGLADVMERALASFSSGQVNQPVRASVHVDKQQAFFGVMPAYLSTAPALGAKLVTVFSGNAARGLPAIRARWRPSWTAGTSRRRERRRFQR